MKKFLNIIKNPKTKMIFILSSLIFLYSSLCAFSYAKIVSNSISDSVFRLHVIANSNSKEDQDLKYLVRDNLIDYMNKISINCSSKTEAIAIAKDNIDNFKKIVETTIMEKGYNYDVKK